MGWILPLVLVLVIWPLSFFKLRGPYAGTLFILLAAFFLVSGIQASEAIYFVFMILAGMAAVRAFKKQEAAV